jgi:hypothetical protein
MSLQPPQNAGFIHYQINLQQGLKNVASSVKQASRAANKNRSTATLLTAINSLTLTI